MASRDDLPDQTGRTAVVTGANSGLGFHVAAGLAAAGAHVVLACRNEQKAADAVDRLRAQVPDADVTVRRLDLSDLASVRQFVDGYAASYDRLDVLVNNAGLMAIDEARTADGFEMQIGVNHLGHHVLTAGLLPLMLDVPGSRVGTMSSIGHRPGRIALDDLNWERRRYLRWPAYFQSKLANLLFTADLQRRLASRDARTVAVAAHPGVSRTDLGYEGSSLSNRAMPLVAPFLQPAEAGARPMLRAVTGPDVRGGEYYGPALGGWGPPRRERPSATARKADLALRLGALTADLTGTSLPV